MANEMKDWVNQAKNSGESDEKIKQKLSERGYSNKQTNILLNPSPKKKNKILNQTMIIAIVVLIIIIFVGGFYLSKSTILAPMTLWYFGFDYENPYSEKSRVGDVEIGGFKCMFLQGVGIVDITFEVDWGSIEVRGKKVARSLITQTAYAQVNIDDSECQSKHIFGLTSEKNEFSEPFKYIAPNIMPPSKGDVISVTFSKGVRSKTEKIIVNLITSEEKLIKKITSQCEKIVSVDTLKEAIYEVYIAEGYLDPDSTIEDIYNVDNGTYIFARNDKIEFHAPHTFDLPHFQGEGYQGYTYSIGTSELNKISSGAIPNYFLEVVDYLPIAEKICI